MKKRSIKLRPFLSLILLLIFVAIIAAAFRKIQIKTNGTQNALSSGYGKKGVKQSLRGVTTVWNIGEKQCVSNLGA